ncbi:MAG: carbamoyl-phosphate synthase large subunit, partial [Candidatus Peribacteraceae bacterium]|nr:carbamoyl-phosphate synthase large subunit [Candidatus Peribacteraceae bacterium]
IKIPRWDLQKFRLVSDQVTSEMKSVGEVMALGRTFEEAFQKAIRMLNIGAEGLFSSQFEFKDLEEESTRPTPRRIFAIAEALKKEMKPEDIHERTGMDMWFLNRINACAKIADKLSKVKVVDPELLLEAKKSGFSDRAIAKLNSNDPEKIRSKRIENAILPVIKQVDTLAGEFPAKTNYLYMTYHGTEHDVNFEDRDQGIVIRESGNIKSPNPQSPIPNPDKRRAIVIGGGPYSIGSSVEFDWCCVQAAHELQRQGYEVAMINSNPETVSTDYDECDQLFFEELSDERVRDIVEIFKPEGIVVSMGGQIPNSLAPKLAKAGLPIMGTAPENIDQAEDRHKFSSLLDELKVDQPEWQEFSDLGAARDFAKQVGYPVIARPSYVLSGASMAVVHSDQDLESYVSEAAFINKETPIVVSKFEQGAKEIEFDGVAQDGKVLLYAISEHIENAGVHSGDATIVLPPQRVNLETLRRVKGIAKKIAKGLSISGPFNIQFLARSNRLKVIECNLRASRSFPFASKVTGENFITLATKALLGKAPLDKRYQTVDLDHVGVKAAQFSFSRLKGADPRLGVEMASTGEVACFGNDVEEALMTALIAVGFKIPRKNILLTIGNVEDKVDMFSAVKELVKRGYAFYATKNTHAFLESRGIPSVLLHKISEQRSPNIKEYLEKKRLDLVINVPTHSSGDEQTDGYYIRRIATDQGIPLITNVQLAKRVCESLGQIEEIDKLPLMKWPELLEEK